MWYPASVTQAPVTEPVTLAEARAQCNVLASETFFDTKLTGLIAAARAHAERYCNVRFGTQTITARCDSFADMARLSEAPLQSVTSIAYVDVAGAEQTVPGAVYEGRADGLEAAVVLKYGQQWPAIRPGSRILLTAVVGHAVLEADVRQAMLLFIGEGFASAEPKPSGAWTSADSLLCNHRRGA